VGFLTRLNVLGNNSGYLAINIGKIKSPKIGILQTKKKGIKFFKS